MTTDPKLDLSNYVSVGEALDITKIKSRQHLDYILLKGDIHFVWISKNHKSKVKLIFKPDL
jgi:hypothetical protein